MSDVKCPACGEAVDAPRQQNLPVRSTEEGHHFMRARHNRCGVVIRAFLDTETPKWEVDRSVR